MKSNKSVVNEKRQTPTYPDSYDHSIIFPEKNHNKTSARKRPVIVVNDPVISESQARLLLVLLSRRFRMEISGDAWEFFEQAIDPKKIGADLFDEIIHCLQGDINASINDDFANPHTRVYRYYSSLDSFMASCKKWNCLKTGGV